MPARRRKTPASGSGKAGTSSEPRQGAAEETTTDSYLNMLLARMADETDSEPEREPEEPLTEEKEMKDRSAAQRMKRERASIPITTQASPLSAQCNDPCVESPKPGTSGAPLRPRPLRPLRPKTTPQPSPNSAPIRRSSLFRAAAGAPTPVDDPFDSTSPEVSEDEGEAWIPTRLPLPGTDSRYLCIGKLVLILFAFLWFGAICSLR